jgi:hypothetical protein
MDKFTSDWANITTRPLSHWDTSILGHDSDGRPLLCTKHDHVLAPNDESLSFDKHDSWDLHDPKIESIYIICRPQIAHTTISITMYARLVIATATFYLLSLVQYMTSIFFGWLPMAPNVVRLHWDNTEAQSKAGANDRPKLWSKLVYSWDLRCYLATQSFVDAMARGTIVHYMVYSILWSIMISPSICIVAAFGAYLIIGYTPLAVVVALTWGVLIQITFFIAANMLVRGGPVINATFMHPAICMRLLFDIIYGMATFVISNIWVLHIGDHAQTTAIKEYLGHLQ